MTKTRKTYVAVCEREDGWWVIHIPELDRATQARRLDQAEAMARDLLSLWLEVDPSSFDVTLQTQLPDDIVGEIAHAQQLREEADKLQAEAASVARRTARHLAQMRLPLRDIGTVLGVSFQRAGQLVGDHKTARGAALLQKTPSSSTSSQRRSATPPS